MYIHSYEDVAQNKHIFDG